MRIIHRQTLMILQRICIALFAVLTLQCENGFDPANPVTQPEVLSTLPARDAIGPFGVLGTSPHCLISFSKIMDISSINAKSVSVSGFTDSITVTATSVSSSGHYGEIVDLLFSGKRLSPWEVESTYYSVGKQYTVTLDTTITDLNGNHLLRPYTFSFIPEPALRILNVIPEEGDTVSTDPPWWENSIEINFNSFIDTAAARRAIHVVPELPGNWWLPEPNGGSARKFVYSFEGRVQPNAQYTISIDGNLSDVQGNRLGETFIRKFYSPLFRVAFEGQPDNMGETFWVRFNTALDTSSIRAAVSVEPPTRYSITISPNWFSVLPDSDWDPSVEYKVSVSSAIKSISGQNWSGSLERTFTVKPLHVMDHYPVNGYVNNDVSRAASIGFKMSGRCDLASFNTALHISPTVPGRLSRSGEWILFMPDSVLKPFTVYTITLDRTVRSLRGSSMLQPFEFSFLTGGQIMVGATRRSFSEGPIPR